MFKRVEKRGTTLAEHHLDYMNLGARYRGAIREDLSESQLGAVQGYLDKLGGAVTRGLGLYLYGNNSLGKTYIASVLCKEVRARYRVGSFITTASQLKEAWIEDYDLAPDESFIHRCNTVRFLVIDDAGREYRTASGFAENQFGALLRRRSRNKLTTSITSNLDPKEFSEIYGKGSGELAKECMAVVKLTGPNVRDQIASESARYLQGH